MVSDAGSYAPVPLDLIQRAPKVLLHDHLDGGMRPQTIVELADQDGYADLPTTDPVALERWFTEAAFSGSLERYLETFAHTVGVTQTPDALRRVAREAAEDLADDGVRGGRCRHFGGGRPAGEESCREQDEGEGDRGGERRRQRAAVENGGPFPAHGAHRLADCSREGPALARSPAAVR